MATYLRDPIISYARRSAPSMCGRNSVFAPLLVTISALHSVCSNQPVTMHVGQSAVRSGATGFVANCRLRFAHSSSSLSPNPAAAATRRAVPQKARRAEFSMSSDTSRPLIAFPGGAHILWRSELCFDIAAKLARTSQLASLHTTDDLEARLPRSFPCGAALQLKAG
eukprot:1418584-Rhodomonas_salina.2